MAMASVGTGGRLYYELHGAGDPVLLIAGQAQDHTMWAAQLSALSERFLLIVFDHRGTGRSDGFDSADAVSTRDFADDAVALLTELGIARAHVVGHSMGGRIAQWIAIDHPARTGALVLSATTPGDANGVRRPAHVDTHLSRGDHAQLVDQLFSPDWSAAHPEEVARVFAALTPSPLARRLHYGASQAHDSWARLPAITAPTLVVTGSEDQFNPAANSELLASRIPHARLGTVPGGRHGYLVEFRTEFTEIVAGFLAAHGRSVK